jgi:hypothetical protein
MKKSSLILIVIFGLFIISLITSVLIFKNEYNHIDKTDPFWNYPKLASGTFHHILLSGGNITRASFIPSPHGSVGVLNYTDDLMKGRVHATISDDTLFVLFKKREDPPGIRKWMSYHVLIAISCPKLLSVNIINSNLDLYKLRQKNLSVQLAGKSKMEIESSIADFDSLSVRQKDSTEVKFEMSEDMKSSGTMHSKAIYAQVQGYSILDLGHFQIHSFHPFIEDSSAIILSGHTLKKMGSIQ